MLWIKQLSLIVGVEVHAISIAVSAFFGGLAVGSWYFGRKVDAAGQPWKLYAALEACVAVSAVVSTALMAIAAPWFVWLEARTGALAWCLPFVLVGVPAIFMGGTVPVLLRACRPASGALAGVIGGKLYAANTAGAVLGVLTVPFLLMPEFGIQGSARVAAALNLLIALLALAVQRRADRAPVPQETIDPSIAVAGDTAPHAAPATPARFALSIYAVAGGIALGYEVFWSQALVQFVSTRAFAFAVVLATYLSGIALGSSLVSRHVARCRDVWGTFATLIAASAASAVVMTFLLGDWIFGLQADVAHVTLQLSRSETVAMCARFLVASGGVVFIPTLFLGAAFPYALRMATNEGHIGQNAGRLIALNTVGGIVGTLVTGFWLIPTLGLVRTLAVLAGGAAITALIVVVRRPADTRARVIVVALGVLAAATALLTPADRFASLLANARGGDVVLYKEAQGATVTVLRQASTSHTFNRLYIQGVSNSGDTMTSLRYMRLQALLPLIISNGEPKSAMVIGLGTGITAGALLQYPGLVRRETAELLPAVVQAAAQFQGNYGVTSDPRMRIRVTDGRRALLANERQFDLITLEPPPPSAAGVANLYSTDFYHLAAQRLTTGGMVAQWLPLPTQNEADTKALIASFIKVFPNASLWTTELHEMLLVGSMQPQVLDAGSISRRYAQPQVSRALREVGIGSAGALLATWVTDRAGLAYYVEDTAPVTDDRPSIEYAPWVRSGAFPNTLEHLLALQGKPPIVGASPELDADYTRSRAALQAFYRASLAAMSGDRSTWRARFDQALSLEANNPYFNWFVASRPTSASQSAPQRASRPITQ
ncbi:spermidine synthase [Pandoraea norimbergensis]|uniref:Spermidine synthase n=2 Tax=Pandoraea norimbergensis TaxID=93219 RepID=A0ABN4JQ55_9BURK|nr:spermidine synthase [Pandoraea norimbergensis]